MEKSEVQKGRRALVVLPAAAGLLYLLGHKDSPPVPLDFNVKEVLVEEAKALIAAGALILDVRERVAYEARHIPGALLAPLSKLSSLVSGSLAQAKASRILVYCGDGRTIGPEGTHILNSAGFAGAVNLKPGIQGWAAAGLPVEQGKGQEA